MTVVCSRTSALPQICLSDDTAEEPDSDVSPARVSQPQQPADVAAKLEQAAAEARRVARPAAGQHPILERNRRALEQLQRAAVEEPVDLISSSEGEYMRTLPPFLHNWLRRSAGGLNSRKCSLPCKRLC